MKGADPKGQSHHPSQQESSDERSEKRRHKGWPIVIILIVVIALFVMLAYWIYKSTISERDTAMHIRKQPVLIRVNT